MCMYVCVNLKTFAVWVYCMPAFFDYFNSYSSFPSYDINLLSNVPIPLHSALMENMKKKEKEKKNFLRLSIIYGKWVGHDLCCLMFPEHLAPCLCTMKKLIYGAPNEKLPCTLVMRGPFLIKSRADLSFLLT